MLLIFEAVASGLAAGFCGNEELSVLSPVFTGFYLAFAQAGRIDAIAQFAGPDLL